VGPGIGVGEGLPVLPVGAGVGVPVLPVGAGVGVALLPVLPVGLGEGLVVPVGPVGDVLPVLPVDPVGAICASAAVVSPNDDKIMVTERVRQMRWNSRCHSERRWCRAFMTEPLHALNLKGKLGQVPHPGQPPLRWPTSDAGESNSRLPP
jgi:hypothetical protein